MDGCSATTDDVAPGRSGRWYVEALVAAGYVGVSLLYWGSAVLRHPGRSMLGTGPDNEIFVWAFAWWPHAILHWTNPFVTHAIYAPGGANLVWATSVPALALLFAPLTLAFGPVVSFNVAALSLPAVGAWAAYRLCLELTRSRWASLIGGYLFGFSSFVLAQQITAHVFLTANFVLPLVALCLVRFVRGDWTRLRFALWFGALMALQLMISTEVALTLSVMLVLAVGLALLLVPAVRARPGVGAFVRAIAEGYCFGAIFAAPFVVYALSGFRSQGFVNPAGGTDLLNLIFPTQVNAVAGDAFPSLLAYFDSHDDAIYLGLPILIVVGLYVWQGRRARWTAFLVAALVVPLVFALGPTLRVAGHEVVELPWSLLDELPLFDNVATQRFGAFASLAASVIVALWIAQAHGRIFSRPYVLPVLAVAALIPAFWQPVASLRPQRPAFFTAGLYKTCLEGEETLAIFPHRGEANLVQAESGFPFRVAGGYLTPLIFGAKPIIGFNDDPTIVQLNYFTPERGAPDADALRAFAVRHGVDRFVSFVGEPFPAPSVLRSLGPVGEIGGVYVAPKCGSPSLRTRPVPASARQMLAYQRDGATITYCLDGYTYDLPAGLRPGGIIEGATRAVYVLGEGLRCSAPATYVRRGFAPDGSSLPEGAYALFAPR